MLNDFNIAHVHVHQVSLLPVVGLPPGQAGLHQRDRVGELRLVRTVDLLSNTLGFRLLKLRVVAFSKLLLQNLNFAFKCLLVFSVFAFQSEDLVVGILAEPGAVVGGLAVVLDLTDLLLDLTLVVLVDTRLVFQLLAPDVDLPAESLVLSLQVVVLLQGSLATVLQTLDLTLVLVCLGSGGTDSLKLLLFFFELFTQLLLVVLEDHQVPIQTNGYEIQTRKAGSGLRGEGGENGWLTSFRVRSSW